LVDVVLALLEASFPVLFVASCRLVPDVDRLEPWADFAADFSARCDEEPDSELRCLEVAFE
jgi:hypothetical protein